MIELVVCLIVKNSGVIIKKTLESYLASIDKFCILDTGSTDGTQQLIIDFYKDYSEKSLLREEPFVDFSTSRNRCFELCKKHYKDCIAIMIDDSYLLKENYPGAFKEELLTVQKLEVAAIKIKTIIPDESRTEEHISKRIINLNHFPRIKYIGAIHEDINAVDCWLMKNSSILDIKTNYHLKRSMSRITTSDVSLLQEQKTARGYYHLGQTYKELRKINEAIDCFEECLKIDLDNYPEQKYLCYKELSMLYSSLGDNMISIDCLLKSIKICPERRAESEYILFLLGYSNDMIKEAYKHSKNYGSDLKLPYDITICNKISDEYRNFLKVIIKDGNNCSNSTETNKF